LKPRRVGVDGGDDVVRGLLSAGVPAAGTFVGEVLAEQACDMGPGRGEAVVEGGGDQHLDDRLLRPAVALRVDEGTVHIAERGRHDDSAGEVVAGLRAPR
jgi:hypothetical protein